MTLTLLILAAGMGSRYGGLKQLDPVGPTSETIMDYAIFDAIRAGFKRIVFVIRRDFEVEFREKIGAKYADFVDVGYVCQELHTLPPGFIVPPGRVKPWGTAHAVWCAREVVDDPFAVVNADDFYGRDSFEQLGKFLREQTELTSGPADFAMVGFSLGNTLSENGAVSRGLCAVAADGMLQTVCERTGIIQSEVGTGGELTGREIISLNCWGFTRALFPMLERQLTDFLRATSSDLKAEFYLPNAVAGAIAEGCARVRVLPTQSSWFGVTYQADKPRVVAAIRALVARGEYSSTVQTTLKSEVIL